MKSVVQDLANHVIFANANEPQFTRQDISKALMNLKEMAPKVKEELVKCAPLDQPDYFKFTMKSDIVFGKANTDTETGTVNNTCYSNSVFTFKRTSNSSIQIDVQSSGSASWFCTVFFF